MKTEKEIKAEIKRREAEVSELEARLNTLTIPYAIEYTRNFIALRKLELFMLRWVLHE